MARETFVPWIDAATHLTGKRVVDFGGGSGSMALALASHVDSVLCLDESASAVDECASRARASDIRNVTTRSASFSDLLSIVTAEAGDIDVFLLFAVLEHMTLSERLAILETALSVLAPDGVIVVGETPNRLLWNDYHTTETPFFGFLPDELAVRLCGSIRRTELRDQLVHPGLTSAERHHMLTRFGRGVSYHEFEAVFGIDVHDHVIGGGWDPALHSERPEQRDEIYLATFLAEAEPRVASHFARYWIDLIVRPGSPAPAPAPRLWRLHSLASRAVAVTPAQTAIVDSGGALVVDLPCSVARIAINVVVSPAFAVDGPVLRISGDGWDRRVTFERHDPSRWIQQGVLDVDGGCDTITVTSHSGSVEISAVMFWPTDDRSSGAPPVVGERVLQEVAADEPGVTGGAHVDDDLEALSLGRVLRG